ncbi:MAG: tetratricopeptide repeat protein, partial [bacterium]|nr:tetratricopeptide repeat protein [bacterium]
MTEEQEYGKRIYVKKRKRINPWPYIVVVLLLAGSWFFFSSLNKEKNLPGMPTTLTPETGETTAFEPEPTGEENDPAAENQETPRVGDVIESGETGSPLPDPAGTDVPAVPAKSSGLNDLYRAHKYYIRKKYRKALPLYENLSAGNREARVYAGICHYRLENYNDAYTYLERALDEDGNHFLALKFMALTCYKIDRLSASLTHAEKGLAQISDPQLQSLRNKLKREQQVMKGYGSTKKPNFKVLFSKFEHQEVKETVLDILKEAFRTIGREINFYPRQSITVILYNEKGFFDVTRAPGWAGGLYDGKIRIPVKGVEGRERMLKRILFHEYTHALVHAITPRCPRWLNEGLAEYFSEDEELLKIGEKLGQAIPLKYLERGFPSGDTRLVAAAYLISYTAV